MVPVRPEGNGWMVLIPARALLTSRPEGMDEFCVLPVGQVPRQIRRRTRHRFRRVRNRAGSRRLPRHRSCRQAAAPTAEDGRSRGTVPS
jgi:hypothetical protein